MGLSTCWRVNENVKVLTLVQLAKSENGGIVGIAGVGKIEDVDVRESWPYVFALFDCFAIVVCLICIVYILCGSPRGAPPVAAPPLYLMPAGSGTPGIAAFRIS